MYSRGLEGQEWQELIVCGNVAIPLLPSEILCLIFLILNKLTQATVPIPPYFHKTELRYSNSSAPSITGSCYFTLLPTFPWFYIHRFPDSISSHFSLSNTISLLLCPHPFNFCLSHTASFSFVNYYRSHSLIASVTFAWLTWIMFLRTLASITSCQFEVFWYSDTTIDIALSANGTKFIVTQSVCWKLKWI